METITNKYTPHWAEKLETGDRCLGTIRHETDGSKNLKNVKLIVISNNLTEKRVVAVGNKKTFTVPYNELKEIKLNWVIFNASECPKCGDEPEVLTKSKKHNWVYDEEEARCSNCHHPGYVEVEDSECADIVWQEGRKVST